MARTIRLCGAGPDQSDRRAHRLQPGLRAADRAARAHRRDLSTRATPTRSPCEAIAEDGEVRIPLDTAPGDVAGWAAYVAGVDVGAARVRSSVPGGDDVDRERRRDGLGCGVVGGAGMRGSRRDHNRHRLRHRPRRAGPDRATRRKRIRRRANGSDGPTGRPVRRATAGVADRLPGDRVRPVSFDPDASGVALLLINSPRTTPACRRRVCVPAGIMRTRRSRSRASPRCAMCRIAALTVLDAVTDPVDARRARHILDRKPACARFRCRTE